MKVLLPVPGDGPRVDLLFCAHHYQRYRDTLVQAGGEVYESGGWPLDRPAPRSTSSQPPTRRSDP